MTTSKAYMSLKEKLYEWVFFLESMRNEAEKKHRKWYSESYKNQMFFDSPAEMKIVFWIQINILFELKWNVLFQFDVLCLLAKYF